MKYDYAIEILRGEMSRLLDKEIKLFTPKELTQFDFWISELKSAIEVLKKEGEKE